MKTLLIACLLMFSGSPAQTKVEPKTYRFSVDYQYSNTKGESMHHEMITALYTRNLPDDQARWNQVAVSNSIGSSDKFKPPVASDFMEGFTYPRTSEHILEPEFFKTMPTSGFLEHNLVWDVRMFEAFGQGHFEDMAPNVPFHPSAEAVNIDLAGTGTFQNRNVELIWTGISTRNGVECAVIDYRALFNRLEIRTEGMNIDGRSNYWGQIWVSLQSRQIEYATLFEDVLGEVRAPGQDKPQVTSMFRTGIFEPVKNQ